MKKSLRLGKHNKIRKKILGSSNSPRLSVFRSAQHIYAQIIDDSKSETLAFANDLKLKGNKKERAYNVGMELAKKAVRIKIQSVVFDRGGFLYHGRIEDLAKGAREGGLKF